MDSPIDATELKFASASFQTSFVPVEQTFISLLFYLQLCSIWTIPPASLLLLQCTVTFSPVPSSSKSTFWGRECGV